MFSIPSLCIHGLSRRSTVTRYLSVKIYGRSAHDERDRRGDVSVQLEYSRQKQKAGEVIYFKWPDAFITSLVAAADLPWSSYNL